MLIPLGIGSALMVINLLLQVLAVTLLIRFFNRRVETISSEPTFGKDAKILMTVMFVLFAGHVLQFATWALLFTWLGEFEEFATAFYHSTVNFTSLGYGDIVMSERWRLLGALEAANGVLMFGLSAGTILSVMNGLFDRRKAMSKFRSSLDQSR